MSHQPPYEYATYFGGESRADYQTSYQGGPEVHVEFPQAVGRRIAAKKAAPERLLAPQLVRTLEFRLAESEKQEQSVPVPTRSDEALAVAINNVRSYLAANHGVAREHRAIAGIEVQAELRNGVAVCRARSSDFAPGEVVVVQAALMYYRGVGKEGEPQSHRDHRESLGGRKHPEGVQSQSPGSRSAPWDESEAQAWYPEGV